MKRNIDDLITNDTTLLKKFSFIEKISTSSSRIYLYKVLNRAKNEIRVLKIQNDSMQLNSTHLIKENIILNILNPEYFPKIFSTGKWSNGFYIQIELLEETLQYFSKKNKFTLQKTLQLGFHLLKGLKNLHQNNFIHCNLTTHNIMRRKNGDFVIIDFRFANQVNIQKGKESEVFLANKEMEQFRGSPLFGSIRSHMIKKMRKKDDIESLLYVLAYIYLRKLPWASDFKNLSLLHIRQKKESQSKQMFQSMSSNFIQAFNYLSKIKSSIIDYEYLLSLMKPTKGQKEKRKQILVKKSNFKSKNSQTSEVSILNSKKAINLFEDDSSLSTIKKNFAGGKSAQKSVQLKRSLQPLRKVSDYLSIQFKNPFLK